MAIRRNVATRLAAGLLLASLAGAACTTVERQPVSGTPIETDVIERIVPNETTKAQVEEWLGPPASVVRGGDTVEWRYAYTGFIVRSTEAVVYARETSDRETKTLRMTLRDDVVISVCLTNTFDSSENVEKPENACRGLPRTYAVLLPEKDGTVGKIELQQGRSSRLQDKAREATGFDPNRETIGLSDSDIEGTFGKTIDALPPDPARFVLYFESDSTTLTAESRKLLPEVLAEVKRRPAPELVIVGHTDRVGSPKYNVMLGFRRAGIVREAVKKIGVEPKLMEITSLGEADPIVKTKDGVREPKNRRVEAIVR
jgi:outer membrane protein OmpA-like peptidoglycan-associated protein